MHAPSLPRPRKGVQSTQLVREVNRTPGWYDVSYLVIGSSVIILALILRVLGHLQTTNNGHLWMSCVGLTPTNLRFPCHAEVAMAPEVANSCLCMYSASFPHVHLLGTLASSSGVLDPRKIDSDTAPTLPNITRTSTLPGDGPHHLPSFDLLYRAEGPVYLQNERKPVANWGHLRFLKQ